MSSPTTLDAALAAYRATWARVDGIVAGAALATSAWSRRRRPGQPALVLGHLLEETARTRATPTSCAS
jgi:hypothetical protein